MKQNNIHPPRRLAAVIFAFALVAFLPFRAEAQGLTGHTPGNVDHNTYQLRMWMRADKPATLELVDKTPSNMTWTGEPEYDGYSSSSLKYYVPFRGETDPTGPHKVVSTWYDYAGTGPSGGTSPASGFLGALTVNPLSTTSGSPSGVGLHRGTVWAYLPNNNGNGSGDKHRNLPPVWFSEHPLTNYHPTVYFWYRSPDGNLKGNDEEGAFLTTKDKVTPFMNSTSDSRPLEAEHTAFFLANSSFPASVKRVFFMGFNGLNQDNSSSGPSWGIYRIDKSANKDLGMSNGRFRTGGPLNQGYDNGDDPGLIRKYATTVAAYQTYGYTGSGYSTQYQDIYLDFIFNGSKLSVGNSGEGTHWNYVTTREGTLGACYDRFMGGLISEVILFEKKLPATEIAKINSYLALKYGITLSNATVSKNQGISASYNRGDALKGENDYTINNGSTMVWQGTSSATVTGNGSYKGFYHNLAAVVHDETTELLNLQAHSTDAGAIIRMGYISGAGGTAGTANYLGPNMTTTDLGALPDQKFVMWGHDAGLFSNATYTIPNTICVEGAQMMNRTWMVRKTDGSTPYRMLISAQNNNELFEDDAFPFGADVDVYLCIADSYDDVRSGDFHTVIKAEYVNGEHQFDYKFKSEFTYFTLAYVATGISESCHGKQITPGAYLNFSTPTAYPKGYALPWVAANIGTPPAHFHQIIGTIPATATTVQEDLVADVTSTYDNAVGRPGTRFPRARRGFLRVTRKGGSSVPTNNQVIIDIGTHGSGAPTTPVPTIPSFTISSINRRHNTFDEVSVYGVCDGNEVKAKLSYAASASNSRYVIENGNHARAFRKGAAGRRNPKGQALVTFNQAVSKVFVEYTTSLNRKRNHIDIFPVTYKPAPIPPIVNDYGMSFTKEAERNTVSVCEEVVYWLRLQNYKPNTDVTVKVEDVLPAGMIWSSTDVMIDDTLNMGRIDRGLLSVSKSGQNLTLTGLVVPKSCDPATGGKVAIRIVAMFDYSNTAGGTYNNQATCTPTTPATIPAFNSVDAYTNADYTTVTATAATRPAPLTHTFTASEPEYRENDEITLTWVITNANNSGLTATAKSACELELDFDAGFEYVAGSYSGPGDETWDATDSLFYVENMIIPVGTTTISLKVKAPKSAEWEYDDYGAPVVGTNGKPQKATLNIEYEFFSGSDDPCDDAAMNDLWGEKEIPYQAAPRYVVVNQEINHVFSNPVVFGLIPGIPLTPDQTVCEGYGSADISAITYSPAAGGEPATTGVYSYIWESSADGLSWTSTGVTTASYAPSTGLSAASATAAKTYYFRRVASDGTTSVAGVPALVTVYPTIGATGNKTENVVSGEAPVPSFHYHSGLPVIYTWTVLQGDDLVSGDSPGTGDSIYVMLTNMTSSPKTIKFNVTPKIGSCEGPSFELTVTVAGAPCSPPPAPVPETPQTFCSSATVNDLNPAPSATIKWYNSSDVELTSGAALANGATYYCREFSDTCKSDKSIDVTVSIVTCAASLTTFTNVMYDFQHQTLESFVTSGPEATGWQWQYSQTSTDADFVNCPGTSNAATYTVPADFVYDYGVGTAYADTIYFRCLLSNGVTQVSTDNTFNILFIKTKTGKTGGYLPGYGEDANGVKYLTLKKGAGGVVAADSIKIALLNLGQSEGNDAGDLGDFYQWGRVPDGHEHIVWRKGTNHVDSILPMIGGANNTSEPIAGPTSSNGNYTGWNNEVGANFDQVLAGASEAGKFITASSGTWSSIVDSHRWGSASASASSRNPDKTANDPCPAGWQVPSRWQFFDIHKGNGTGDPSYGDYSDDTDNDWVWRAATNNAIGGAVITNTTTGAKVFLPAANYRRRDNGELDNFGLSSVGLFGDYWSSTRSSDTCSYYLYFLSTRVNPGDSHSYRAYGASVRCVQEFSDLCYDSNTTGTEFYVAFGKNHNADNDPTTPNSGQFGDPYLAVDVSAKVNTNVTFTFTYDDSTVVQTVNAGSVYRLEMKDIPTLKKIYPNDTIYTPSDLKKTLKITSDQPISVYAFNTYRATTDATIVLPTSAWGKSYFTVSYRPEKTPTMNGSNRISYYAQQLIVAKENGTTVTAFNADGTVETAQTLDAGQLYTYIGPSAADITGSSIVADKPIGVFSHTRLSRVPEDRNYADIMYEQMQSVERWGRRFLVPNAQQGTNDMGNRIRILASQNGTNITYDGATQIASGVTSSNFVASGTVLNAKQFIELEMSPVAGQYCVITSDKPVAVCAYMVGQGNVNAAKGDPSIAWIPALDQMITDALIQPFMFSTDTKVDYTNFDGFLQGGLSADGIYHLATVIVPTTAKSSTKVNGTPLSTLWSGDTWTDDATTGYSFLVHQFDNGTDLGKDFLISNPSGVMALAYGYTNVESYYYNAGCGTCLRGITPAYHGPSCLSSPAGGFPVAPTGYTYQWDPATIGTGTFSVTVTDNSNGLSQTYLNALTVGATTFATPTIGASTSNAITYGSNNVEYWVTSPEAGVTYNWSVPEWMMITSGQGTDRIRVEVPWPAGYSVSDTPPDVTGTVTVTPSNGCSTGTAGTVSVGAKKGT